MGQFSFPLKRIPKSSFILAVFFILLIVLYINAQEDFTSEGQKNLTLLLAVLAFILILVGNYLLGELFDKYLDWKTYAGYRFFTQMILGTLYSLFCLNVAYIFVKSNFSEAPPELEQIITLNVWGSAIILPMFSFFFGFKFLKAWRKSEIESERLQKENARSQMMTLRNHLDPHFLFNNLNTVSSLIDYDTKLSKDYLDKFAEVYRIILKTEYSDLTTVNDELNLIDSYIYLLKIRFQDRIFFEIDISDADKKMAMLPLSLQMLIENAIKHNVASRTKPIYIKIKSEAGNFISVSNNKQIKKYDDVKRNGTGLENIKKRYAFFTNNNLKIIQNDEIFKVNIPLLEIDYD